MFMIVLLFYEIMIDLTISQSKSPFFFGTSRSGSLSF